MAIMSKDDGLYERIKTLQLAIRTILKNKTIEVFVRQLVQPTEFKKLIPSRDPKQI